jgi:hypothetical protein
MTRGHAVQRASHQAARRRQRVCQRIRLSDFFNFSGLVRRGTLFAGEIRPGAALFVPRVRESYILHVVTKLVAAQKHGVSLEKTARMASTSAKMPRSQNAVPDLSGPLAGRVLCARSRINSNPDINFANGDKRHLLLAPSPSTSTTRNTHQAGSGLE